MQLSEKVPPPSTPEAHYVKAYSEMLTYGGVWVMYMFLELFWESTFQPPSTLVSVLVLDYLASWLQMVTSMVTTLGDHYLPLPCVTE